MNITAMFIFGTIGIFRKYTPISSGLLAMVRGVVGSIFLIAFVKIRGGKIRTGIGFKKGALLAISGALIGINWVMLFESYSYTTVATATLCYYMAPTFVILLAPIFLKEKLTLKKGLCALVAIVGMAFVSGVVDQGLPGAEELMGILLGLGAALIYAIVLMFNKKLTGIDTYEKTIIQLVFAAIVMVPYLFATGGWEVPEFSALLIIMLLIMGLVHTGAAYAIYFDSVDKLPAGTVALFAYIDPVVAVILSAIILKESMTIFTIIGAVLIIGAAVVSELKLKTKKAVGTDTGR